MSLFLHVRVGAENGLCQSLRLVTEGIQVGAHLVIAEYDTHAATYVSLWLAEDADASAVFLQGIEHVVVERLGAFLWMNGKLVPQDPNDEPASELLKRINSKAESISDNGHYQNLPKGWCLTTLESITNYGSCVNVSVQEIPKDAWVLELEDIEKDSAKILCARHKKDREIKGVRHRFKAGDILYSKLRTYLNKVLIAPNEGFCTTEIIPISVKLGIHNKYICHVLRSQAFLDYTAQCGYGVKMPRLSTKDAQNGIIPLPPYNEQLRIVSMVEKLLADLGTIEESLAR